MEATQIGSHSRYHSLSLIANKAPLKIANSRIAGIQLASEIQPVKNRAI
jgi:hypothetical protein